MLDPDHRHADDIGILARDKRTLKKVAGKLIIAAKELRLQVNGGKSHFMWLGTAEPDEKWKYSHRQRKYNLKKWKNIFICKHLLQIKWMKKKKINGK